MLVFFSDEYLILLLFDIHDHNLVKLMYIVE